MRGTRSIAISLPYAYITDFRSLFWDDIAMLLDWLQGPYGKEWWDNSDDGIDKIAADWSRELANTQRIVLI